MQINLEKYINCIKSIIMTEIRLIHELHSLYITSLWRHAKLSKANRCHGAELEECDFHSYKIYTIYPSTLYLDLSQYLNPDSSL